MSTTASPAKGQSPMTRDKFAAVQQNIASLRDNMARKRELLCGLEWQLALEIVRAEGHKSVYDSRMQALKLLRPKAVAWRREAFALGDASWASYVREEERFARERTNINTEDETRTP